MSNIQNVPGMKYYRTDDVIPEKEEFKSVLGWWLKLRKSRQLPSISDVAFKDLKGWHSHLVLTRVTEDRKDLEVRIIGEGALGLYGPNIRPGICFTELVAKNKTYGDNHLTRILGGEPISYYEGPMQFAEREHINVSSLCLPFADEKGQLSHFLAFFSPL